MAIKDDMEDIQEAVINELITENGITNTLADGQVIEAKIANNAVTAAKIADGSVTAAKIADGSVTPPNLAQVLLIGILMEHFVHKGMLLLFSITAFLTELNCF